MLLERKPLLNKVLRITDVSVMVYPDHKGAPLFEHGREQGVAIGFTVCDVADAPTSIEQLCARFYTAPPTRRFAVFPLGSL